MSDATIASLIIAVDSRPVQDGVEALKGLAQQGGNTEASLDKLASTNAKLAGESRKLMGASDSAASSLRDMTSIANQLQAAVAKGDLVKLINPINGVVSYAPAMLANAEAANRLASANKELAATAAPTAAALDKMAASASHAASSYDTFYDAAQRDFASQYVAQQTRVSTAHAMGAKGAKLQGFELANLGRQFADVGVSAAMGISPLMILIQQGPQVADVFATASSRGVGFSAVLRQIGVLAAPVAVALAPLIALLAAGAAGFGLLNHELSKKYPKDITDGLGLTAEQLERVKSKTVTVGDTFKATLDVMGKYLTSGPVGDGIKWLGKQWDGFLDAASKGAFEGTARIVGAFLGAYQFIVNNWRNFPAVLGDLFTMAANKALDAIQTLVNGSVKGLNLVLDAARVLPGLAWLPKIPDADLSRFKGQVSGAAQFVGKSFAVSVENATNDVRRGMRQIGGDIEAAAIAAAKARALKEAGKPAKGGAGAGATGKSDEAREYESVLKAAQAYAQGLEEERAQIGLTETQRVSYRAGLELEKLTTIAQTDAVKAATAAILANRDALIARMGVAELEAASKSRDSAYRSAADATPRTDAANLNADGLNAYADLVDQVAAHTQDAAQGMADSFGRVGAAIGNLTTIFANLDAQQADIAARRATEEARYTAIMENAKSLPQERARAEIQWTKAQTLAANESRQAVIKSYGDQISAAKGFFKEGSTGYKVLEAAEKAFRLFQFAMSVKAVFFKTAETTATVTNAGATIASDTAVTASTVAKTAIQAAAHGVVAIARAIASLPFPLNLAAGAATAAALIGFGVNVAGGGGGGSTVDTSAQDRQAAAGTGSVLGDSKAKSESIAKALEIVASNTNKDLEYSNGMLRALRSIDNNIASLTAALARQLGVGGAFDTSDLGLGKSTQGPSWRTRIMNPISNFLPGLFGSTKTRTLTDQGIEFDPSTLGAIANGGLNGSTYADVATNTKKKFFGITYSNKTKNSTTTSPLDADIIGEVQRVIASLRDGVLSAAGVLGVEGAQAALDAFTVDLGKISFKDLTGQEIQDQLNAIFGKLGDDLASTVLPDLEKFQKAGEGAFETLARVARGYQVVDISLQSIGRTFGAVGVASIEARQRLIDLAGGIDDFAEKTSFFAENFLSEIERLAPIQASVTKELARLGLSNVTTKEQFKQTVLSLDLTTQAGAELYAALLNLAPAFAKVADFTVDGTKEVNAARDALSQAYERERDALQATKDKFDNFAASLGKFRDSLDTGPAALLSPEAQYNATQAAFLSVSAKAKLGDAEALGSLQSVSQAYLDASRAYYASSGNYFKDLEAVKAAVTAGQATAARTASNADLQLAALKEQVSGLITLNDSVLSVRDAIINLNAVKAQQAAAVATATANLQSPVTATGSGTGTPSTPATGQTNWTTYGQHYPDVLAEWTKNLMGKDPRFPTAESYAEWHYKNYGQAEGRVPYARGGILNRPMTLGEAGIGGEAGPEGLFPLVQGPNGLSVHTVGTNDNADIVAELKANREELQALRATLAAHGEAVVRNERESTGKVVRAISDKPTTQRLAAGGGLG